MPRPSRISTALATLTVAGIVGVTGCGSDDSGRPVADSGSSAAASSEPTRQRTPTQRTSKTAEVMPSVEISVQGDRLNPQAKQVELEAGEPLQLQITSDRAGELHVHSAPEQTLSFRKGKSTLTLTIDRPGQVDVEEHESGELLLRLLVR